MKITVRVAVDTGDDTTEPVETQVLALSRDELTPDTLGLHLAEAHELLAALQERHPGQCPVDITRIRP